MDTRKINLFVYDSKENFEKSKEFLGEEGVSFKRMICVDNLKQLELSLESKDLNEDEYVFLAVHVFSTNNVSGVKKFMISGILERYPKLGYMFISDGDETEIQHLMVDAKIPAASVYKYHEVYSNLKYDKVELLTKKQVCDPVAKVHGNTSSDVSDFKSSIFLECDYAIITALEEDEMEKVLPMIQKEGTVPNDKHLIEYGHLKSNSNKKIVYASQLATGMIDSSILATELLIRFNPKFLIMTGVLGGKPKDVKIGDVVVATKVFTIDKGKLTDLGFKPELEASNTDNSAITAFKRYKKDIVQYISEQDTTRKRSVDIHFGSIACVRQVIDVEGYFEDEISVIDRKAIALEMESYGVSRACELINNGKTKTLIIKSVMDNTQDKTDDAKTYAAWTSAMFAKYILENNII